MGYPELYYLKLYCKWFFGKCQCTAAALKLPRRRRSPRDASPRSRPLGTPIDVRVPAAAKFDPERRPFQPKYPAEIGLEITAVAVGHRVQRSPVHHDDRGVAPALMRIAELGAREPRARRGLLRHGGDKGAGESGGGQLGHGRPISRVHRVDELREAAAFASRDVVIPRKREEFQLARNGALG